MGKPGYRRAVTIFVGRSGPPRIRLRARGQLASPVAGGVLVPASVGPSGEAITLWADPAGRKALLTPGGLTESCARQPVSVWVVVQDASTTRVTTIDALDLPFCKLQPLPDGRILVVATRGDRAVVFDADGRPVIQGDVGGQGSRGACRPRRHLCLVRRVPRRARPSGDRPSP